MLPIWSSCRFLLSACLLYGEHITLLEIEKGRRFFRPVKADKTTPKYLWFFFCDDAAFLERKVLSKRALEVGNCPRHEILQFKSGQLLRNLHKNLWFKRRNPGSKKPGNGWCAWLCARRIYTGNSLWRSGRDSNPRAAFDDNTISSRARYDLFDTTAYSICWQTAWTIIPKIPGLSRWNFRGELWNWQQISKST